MCDPHSGKLRLPFFWTVVWEMKVDKTIIQKILEWEPKLPPVNLHVMAKLTSTAKIKSVNKSSPLVANIEEAYRKRSDNK